MKNNTQWGVFARRSLSENATSKGNDVMKNNTHCGSFCDMFQQRYNKESFTLYFDKDTIRELVSWKTK
ncbi:MAG: hypothetical protein FWD01_00845 [Defluviitaleaceae bacterium]|nr:hypothetical protein [Defluviitaleaceae bacterium]